MAGDVNDAGLPKISRSITFSRAVPLEVMSKKISSYFAVPAIEKSISTPTPLHGSTCESSDVQQDRFISPTFNRERLRSINKAGRIWGDGFTPKVIWAIVKANATSCCGLATIAPHDLRRTCARLCHQAGGELEQIQFPLGHVSVQTTERYLGCKQRFRDAVNDHIGLKADAPS